MSCWTGWDLAARCYRSCWNRQRSWTDLDSWKFSICPRDMDRFWDMGVSINGGTQKLIVYKGKNHLYLDDDRGYPHFRKPPYGILIWWRLASHLSVWDQLAAWEEFNLDSSGQHRSTGGIPAFLFAWGWQSTLLVDTVLRRFGGMDNIII